MKTIRTAHRRRENGGRKMRTKIISSRTTASSKQINDTRILDAYIHECTLRTVTDIRLYLYTRAADGDKMEKLPKSLYTRLK